MLLEEWSLLDSRPLRGLVELHPTTWLTPTHSVRVWVSATSLDNAHEIPAVEVEIEPAGRRRRFAVNWKDEAACKGLDLNLFFGDDPGTRPALRRSTLRTTGQICHSCPVERECLSSALEHDERGIWGGTSRRQRRDYIPMIAAGTMTIEEVVDLCLPAKQGPRRPA